MTDHFTLAELTRTAVRRVNNQPSSVAIARLRALAESVLEPIRKHFERPVIIHSGYRSPGVNKAVGGSRASQHCKGEAADFHVVGVDFFTVARFVVEHLDFDQLILEFCEPSGFGGGWLHVSFVNYRENRRKITVASSNRGRVVYRNISAAEIPTAVKAKIVEGA